MSQRRRRASLFVLAPLLALALLAGLQAWRAAGPGRAAEWPPLEGAPLASLLAVGDTGAEPWRLARTLQVRMRVGRALAAEDLRQPADALLLLGDNFYPEGLREADLDGRVRANLVEPFCRFLPVAPAHLGTLGTDCPEPPRPAAVWALLGNHDYKSPESPRLQREAIPPRLPSWRLPAAAVTTVAVGSGLSLVLYDPQQLAEQGGFAPLRDAVRAAPGPWRILASHYPLTRRPSDVLGRAAREALADLDVPVHLHLAGHRHYLELARTEHPPFVQAIAGSGSRVRRPKTPVDGSLYQGEHPGFARVDLVAGPAGERLVVSLVALPDSWLGAGSPPRVAAAIAIDRSGRAIGAPPAP